MSILNDELILKRIEAYDADPTFEASHDLAYVYFNNGEYRSCFEVIKPWKTKDSILFAQCCLKIHEYKAGIACLMHETSPESQYLLGELYRLDNNHDLALKSYRVAAKVLYCAKKKLSSLYGEGSILSPPLQAFEAGNYELAARLFNIQFRSHQHTVEDMDYYSTCLWHLKEKVLISELCNDLIKRFPNKAESWCAIGNAFSVNDDITNSIAAFKKAIKLNPQHHYAHTLLGHELAANSLITDAINSFRRAVKLAPRHYNAWYGLGCIYLQQKKMDLAEFHLKKALVVNPNSPTLIIAYGDCVEDLDMRLKFYKKALKLDSDNDSIALRVAKLISDMNQVPSQTFSQ